MSTSTTAARFQPGVLNQAARRVAVIQGVVCHVYGLTAEELLGRARNSRVAGPRLVAMWLSRELTVALDKEIAGLFQRDRSDVSHAMRRIGGLMETEPQFRAALLALRDGLADKLAREVPVTLPSAPSAPYVVTLC